jgi:hypothetical protein
MVTLTHLAISLESLLGSYLTNGRDGPPGRPLLAARPAVAPYHNRLAYYETPSRNLFMLSILSNTKAFLAATKSTMDAKSLKIDR